MTEGRISREKEHREVWNGLVRQEIVRKAMHKAYGSGLVCGRARSNDAGMIAVKLETVVGSEVALRVRVSRAVEGRATISRCNWCYLPPVNILCSSV